MVFVVVLEMGSLAQASRGPGCSHSTVRQYLKRVRICTEQRLFTHEGRELVLTASAVLHRWSAALPAPTLR